jgi:hypothetical protein
MLLPRDRVCCAVELVYDLWPECGTKRAQEWKERHSDERGSPAPFRQAYLVRRARDPPIAGCAEGVPGSGYDPLAGAIAAAPGEQDDRYDQQGSFATI